MPLVLTQNEVNLSDDSYADVLGERYEYPFKYKNVITSGERFVYYRGGRRKKGARELPVYLGTGVIGNIVPVSTELFQCTIENFMPFARPLPFKDDSGKYREPEANNRKAVGFYFQLGVRYIDDESYQAIVGAGTSD